ncbi:unnamed protein product [Spirodela intermedia]|uniref:Flavin-containing monooxygenase n=1 Tax=Spirodela intermedia TaxID=51605 RepID=A0A7I8J8U0_SPIIN|nr:unnamed protein product [Spirodela intermedia]CAA6666509.1 unnamed protein product [Spirodela intermedia]
MARVPGNEDFFARRCVWVNGPIIVGAGPAGLAVGACLREHSVPFVILERADCIASLWQNRTYDRLKLHLPKQFCQLPKVPFPDDFPEYPPGSNSSTISIRRHLRLWRVRTSTEVEYICRWLVAATGENAESVVPEMDGIREFSGEVIHACDYKSGEPYRGKRVLVVGCGNSGMEVCLDLTHHDAFPFMVVRDSVHILPREVVGKSTFEMAVTLMKWLPLWMVDRILLMLAWLVLGNLERKDPRSGHRRPGKIRSGDIKVVPGVRRFSRGKVDLVDGRTMDVDAVILATGYRSNVSSWLQDTDFFAKDGFPRQPFPNGWKGKSGLYAVGFTRRGSPGHPWTP